MQAGFQFYEGTDSEIMFLATLDSERRGWFPTIRHYLPASEKAVAPGCNTRSRLFCGSRAINTITEMVDSDALGCKVPSVPIAAGVGQTGRGKRVSHGRSPRR
jgi:hypothetical protein